MSEFRGLEVKESEELGRLVVAKKDFRIGDLILQEPPLLISGLVKGNSSLSCHNLPEDSNVPTFGCVACFKILSFEVVQFCPKCRWPVCCPECGDEPLHSKYECRLFEEKKIGLSAAVYVNLYIIRGVLIHQDQDPTTWEQLSAVCFSYNLNQDDYLMKRAEKVQNVSDFFEQCCEIKVDPTIIDHIIGACNTTAFGMIGEDLNGNSYRAQAVYYLGSMFCHSCASNATWSVLPYDYNGIKKWDIRIYARRNILCGEAINISYMGDCFALDTTARRSHLKKQYRFDCKCSRCMDSSEFFFYTEAIICPSCGDATLTADDHSDESSLWTCNYCGVCKDYNFAKMCVDTFDPSFIWYNFLQTTNDLTLASSDEDFRLSQNHREVIRASFYFLQNRSLQQFQELFQRSTRCSEMFQKFMETATKCLKVFRMFGSMCNIVYLEWWFARIIAAFYFKTTDFISIPFDPYLPEEKLKIITAICAHLKIAYDTVEWFSCDYMELHFRQSLAAGWKFWNDKLNGLTNMSSVDLSGTSDEKNKHGMCGSEKRSNSNSDEKSTCTKTSPGELSHPVTKGSREEKVVASQCTDWLVPDVFTSSVGSNLALLKPPLSFLEKYDFYFDA